MHLTSPHLKESVPATSDNISDLVSRLIGAPDPFAIVTRDEFTYAQVLWTHGGFTLEHQAGSVDRHFRAQRLDFGAHEIVAILSAYASNTPHWASEIRFEHMQVPAPFSFRLGRSLGKALGRALGVLRLGSSGHS